MHAPIPISSVRPTTDQLSAHMPAWLQSHHVCEALHGLAAAGLVAVAAIDKDTVVSFLEPGPLEHLAAATASVGRPFTSVFEEDHARERERLLADIAELRIARVTVVDLVDAREVWWGLYPVFEDDRFRGVLAAGIRPHPGAALDLDTVAVRRLTHVTAAGPLAGLTLGELEVLRLHALGRRREEMAADLRRTVKAVERRRTTLGRKLDVANAPALTLIGIEAGLHRMSHDELARFAAHNAGNPARSTGLRA